SSMLHPVKYDLDHISAPWCYAGAVSVWSPGGSTMSERRNASGMLNTPTRREVIAGLGIALGGLAAGSEAWGKPQPQAMKATGSEAANKTRTSLHQEV